MAPSGPVDIAVRATHDLVAVLVINVALLGTVGLLLDDGEVRAGAHVGELHPGRAGGSPVAGIRDILY